MARSTFWRLPGHYIGSLADEMPSEVLLSSFGDSNIGKIRPRNGLIVGDLEQSEKFAIVALIGVVQKVDVDNQRLQVHWVKKNLILRPNPSGIVHWRRQKSFNFAPEVAQRYLFKSIFAEELESVNWGTDFGLSPNLNDSKRERLNKRSYLPSSEGINYSNKSIRSDLFLVEDEIFPVVEPFWLKEKSASFPKSGFVYLIQIKDYFKFQSSRFLPYKSNFFNSVRDQEFKIVHAAWFADYKHAERDLQLKYNEHRFDGEFLYLNTDEIRKVKAFGESIGETLLKIDRLGVSI